MFYHNMELLYFRKQKSIEIKWYEDDQADGVYVKAHCVFKPDLSVLQHQTTRPKTQFLILWMIILKRSQWFGSGLPRMYGSAVCL